MIHTTPTTLLAITGLAATATAYKHTWWDHMKCAAAVAQDADYPTCTSPFKFDCFCTQPFDPARVSSAAKDVCKGFGIPTESIHNFICSNDDRHSNYDDVYDHDPYSNCHHAFVYDDDNDRDRHGYPISHPHRLSQPMMRVPAPETSPSDAAKHNPSVQSKRAYAPGLSPFASSSASAYRSLVTDAPSALDEESDYEDEDEDESRVITEIITHTSCDCSSSTVAAATSRASSRPAHLHQSAVPMSTSSSAYAQVHQTVVPVPSSSSAHAHVHQTAIPVSSSSSARAHVHQTVVPVSSSSVSSKLIGSHSYARAHGPASMYVSVPVSVPAPTGVDAQRSGYPSRHKTMASSFMVPSASASASPSPSPSAMTFDGGASGVRLPRSVVVLGLTALMAFFM